MIDVALIEDEPTIREGLASLIHGTPGYWITGKYPSIETALPQIDGCLPDVVLIDIGLPRDFRDRRYPPAQSNSRQSAGDGLDGLR